MRMLQSFGSCFAHTSSTQLLGASLRHLSPCVWRQQIVPSTWPATKVAAAVAPCEHRRTSSEQDRCQLRNAGLADVAQGCEGDGGRQLEVEGSPRRNNAPEQRSNHACNLPRKRSKQGTNGRPWTALHARLQNALRSSRLLDTDSVLLAVSGGQDSVCMLQALVDLQPRWRWRLGVVHCDHRWRLDSAANAEFVRQLVEERLGLPFHLRVAPPGWVQSESAAREWRYRVFAEVAAAHGYSAVVTAHTATDRAETLLLNLLRGAGPDGLVALARSRPLHPAGSLPRADGAHSGGKRNLPHVRLVRPLLEFTRSETAAFVEQMGLQYFHDSTNDCNDIRRNLLRNQVMPGLRQHFNPRLDHALFRFMEVLEGEMQFLGDVTNALYDNVVVAVAPGGGDGDTYRSSHCAAGGDAEAEVQAEAGSGASRSGGESTRTTLGVHDRDAARLPAVALDIVKVRELPLALQRRVVHMWLRSAVRRARGKDYEASGDCGTRAQAHAQDAAGGIRRCRGGVEMGYEDVTRCLALLEAPNHTTSDSLRAGLVAKVSHGLLVLEPAGQQRPSEQGPRYAPAQRGGEPQHAAWRAASVAVDDGWCPEADSGMGPGPGAAKGSRPIEAAVTRAGPAAGAGVGVALVMAEGRLAAARLPGGLQAKIS